VSLRRQVRDAEERFRGADRSLPKLVDVYPASARRKTLVDKLQKESAIFYKRRDYPSPGRSVSSIKHFSDLKQLGPELLEGWG
jgi:hypothetical protein